MKQTISFRVTDIEIYGKICLTKEHSHVIAHGTVTLYSSVSSVHTFEKRFDYI